ncbi:MAG TPA: hypothetical protein VG986_20440, partial [Pseudolabrys sp.]|nr:hypothetical protein [Pseudolabrys sp.]
MIRRIVRGLIIFGVSIGAFWAVGSILLLIMVYIAFPDTQSRDEVARISSPSNRYDAVLYETNGGATTSFGYEVNIVTKKSTAADNSPRLIYLYGARRSSTAYGVNLKWGSEHELIVEYFDARLVKINSKPVEYSGEYSTTVNFAVGK